MHGVPMMRILFAAACITLTACSPIFSENNCSDNLMQTAPSADGLIVANVVRRDCGATTTHANIVYLKKSSDAGGKDGMWGEKVYVLQGEDQVSLAWNGWVLKIKGPTDGQNVFLKRDEWATMKIAYE